MELQQTSAPSSVGGDVHLSKDYDNAACCFCALKTGAVLIGILGSVISGCILWFVGAERVLNKPEVNALVILFLMMYALSCILSTLLILGAIIENSRLILLWFWYNIAMFAVSDVVNACFSGCSDVAVIIGQLFSHAIWVFLIAIVRRFHKRLMERKGTSQDSDVDNVTV